MTHLIPGEEYLAAHKNFRLVGREAEFNQLCSILLRKKANSIVLAGAGGVGCTALCMQLEACKSDPEAIFDIIGKRLFWLDIDEFFSSNDANHLDEDFQAMMKTLRNTPESILIIEDTRDFIEASRNKGCTHFLNALNSAVKNGDTQAILEVRNDDLDVVIKSHSDLRETYTLMHLEEPKPDALYEILLDAVKGLTEHHGIRVEDNAIHTAIQLTNKYLSNINRAQPDRAYTLLDRTLANYRIKAHNLQGLRGETRNVENDKRLRELYELQRKGELTLNSLEEERSKLEFEELERSAKLDNGEIKSSAMGHIKGLLNRSGVTTDPMSQLNSRITALKTEIEKNRKAYNDLTVEINKDLIIKPLEVQLEFSDLSGIDAGKLGQDEKKILLNLNSDLNKLIYGQEEAVTRLSEAIQVAKTGRRDPDSPLAAFFFLGPSGVGKTEIWRALCTIMQGGIDPRARFDMSEYMEKHAVARMIGAPPGYEGFEAGGILTNLMLKNMNRILLFDETEKAHPDVFNVFLQVLSAARLTDNIGRIADFSESIIVMTSNVGRDHFTQPKLSFEEAKKRALEELDEKYPPELLNRFNGRENIICFNRLFNADVEKIVRREVEKLSKIYFDEGLTVAMSDTCVANVVKAKYNPVYGARQLPGFLKSRLRPKIAQHVLNDGAMGDMTAEYNKKTDSFDLTFKENPRVKAA